VTPLRLFALAAAALLAAAPVAARPNIILIMADDIGHEAFNAYGGTSYKTPVTDRMAGAGMRFTHCYSQPVCTPSRNKIMTGRGNRRNYRSFGLLIPGEKTFGNVMKAAGYKTAIAGKWQLTGGGERGMTTEGAGFDESRMWAYPHNLRPEDYEHYQRTSGITGKTSRFWNPAIIENGKYLPTTADDYGPDLYVQFLLDFIDRNRDDPFFIYYPMALTHAPFLATPHSSEINQTTKFKSDKRFFKDMVEYCDYNVGRILARLDEHGLSENTLVLFTGDNGTGRGLVSMLGQREVEGRKAYPEDAGTHVALFAQWKGTVPAGVVNNDLLDFSDFLPTIAEAGDAPLPEAVELDGRSFLDQLRGRPGQPREFIVMDYDKDPDKTKKTFTPVRFARDKRFKLYADGRFFDIPSDWKELHPIPTGAGDAFAEKARRRLREALAGVPSWSKRDGSTYP
jgi:arylsulfatase A